MSTKSVVRPRVQVFCTGPSLVKQSFKDECNISNIMKSYRAFGYVPGVPFKQPLVGDFSNVVDYHSALNAVISADESFMALPSSVRARFDNDPGKCLSFIEDPANAQELVELGLAVRPDVQPVYVMKDPLGPSVEVKESISSP